MRKQYSFYLMVCLLIPLICYAIPPIPARIGGTVTIDGHQLSQNEAKNYSFQVTLQYGSSLKPAAQNTGLNALNWYIVDIPIFNTTDQPGGAHPGDTLKVQAYDSGKELNIMSPADGKIKCGESGSTTQININAKKTP